MTGALKFWDGTAWQFVGSGVAGPAGPVGPTGPQGPQGAQLTPVQAGSDMTAAANTSIILGGSPGKTITLPTTPPNGTVVQVVAQTGPHTITGNGTEKIIWFAANQVLVNSLSIAPSVVMTLQFGSGSPGGWTVVNNPPLPGVKQVALIAGLFTATVALAVAPGVRIPWLNTLTANLGTGFTKTDDNTLTITTAGTLCVHGTIAYSGAAANNVTMNVEQVRAGTPTVVAKCNFNTIIQGHLPYELVVAVQANDQLRANMWATGAGSAAGAEQKGAALVAELLI